MKCYCTDCQNLGRNEKDTYKDFITKKTTYRCKEGKGYKKLDDEICNKFKINKDTGSFRNSGCYITTIVCNILGKKDDHIVLNTMRNFRDNFLKQNDNFIPILQEYDQIGPIISMNIESELNREYVANFAMAYYLVPCVEAYQHGKNILALDYYKEMITFFKQKYDLCDLKVDYDREYNIATLGKGRR